MTQRDTTDWQTRPSFSKRFWVGVLIVLMSVSFFTVSIVQIFDARALAAHNTTATATVTQARYIAHDRGDSYILHYDIQFEGAPKDLERHVPESFFQSHPEGTVFNITIHPDRPRIHDLFPNQTRDGIGGMFFASTVFALFGIWLTLSNGNLAVLRTRFS